MNKADMIYDLSALWAAVKEEFPYFDRLPFDWDAQYHSYLESLLTIEDERAFHQLLTAFMASLNDGHTKYIPPAAFREARPLVRPEKPSFTMAEGVLTIKLNEFLADHAPFVKGLLEANPDASLVRLDIRDNIGGNTFYAANVAKLFISGVFHGCQKWTQAHNAADAAGASQLIGESEEWLRQAVSSGLIREEDLTSARKIMGHTQYKAYTDAFGEEGGEALYRGPVQLLISGKTASAAEDFTAMFKSTRRAMLLGEPTCGSTGTPYMIRLRCGGRGQVVSVGYRLLDGTEFIGKGILPDAPAPFAAQNIL